MKKISGRTKKIIEKIGRNPDLKILDLGCSGGYQLEKDGDLKYGFDMNDYNWLHKNLVQRYSSVTGLEITDSHVNLMNDRGFNVILGDAQKFDLNESFDFVVAGELIEHLTNIDGFLQSVKKHLTKKSKFIITTPFANSLFSFLYSFLYWPKSCSNDEHTLWFCPSTIKLTFEKSGFQIETIEPIMDYRFTSSFSMYNIFVIFVYILYPFLPRRLKCNGMIVVAKLE